MKNHAKPWPSNLVSAMLVRGTGADCLLGIHLSKHQIPKNWVPQNCFVNSSECRKRTVISNGKESFKKSHEHHLRGAEWRNAMINRLSANFSGGCQLNSSACILIPLSRKSATCRSSPLSPKLFVTVGKFGFAIRHELIYIVLSHIVFYLVGHNQGSGPILKHTYYFIILWLTAG